VEKREKRSRSGEINLYKFKCLHQSIERRKEVRVNLLIEQMESWKRRI